MCRGGGCVEVERCVEVECVEVEGVWMDREVCDVHVGSEAERHTYSHHPYNTTSGRR